MTDSLHQQAKAQEFSVKMFASIANAATLHFLGQFEKEMTRKQAEILATDKTDEEKSKEINDYGLAISQRTHLLIRHHTALLVGGFTQDMFPGLMPDTEKKEESEPQHVTDSYARSAAERDAREKRSADEAEEPESIVIGVSGIESEERMFS